MENSKPATLIQLHRDDNVGVLSRSVSMGESIQWSTTSIRAPESIGLGHKFSLQAINRGRKIIKYGVPIGSASIDIPEGTHVHLHNMQSDYLPTYTLEGERNFEG